MTPDPAIGVVVIGRNEGERLRRCLHSLVGRVERIVYVDSGSSDGSVALARSLGAQVVELDLSAPFTMARGRNAGFHRLLDDDPAMAFVQFVDGDCEVVEGWIETASQTLRERPQVVAVAGRRRERFPDASIYNRLCDMEWDGPVGEVRNTGGDVMMRAAALKAAGGFREDMIAGEEPELGVRLRQAGGTILRLPDEMTLHDAAIMRFSQWWKRAVRGGYAYAHGAFLHGKGPDRHNVRQVRSALFWGAAVPVALIALAGLGAFVDARIWIGVALLLSGYAHLGWRIFRQRRQQDAPRFALAYATFCVLAKFAQLAGILRFKLHRITTHRPALIEYKTAAPAAASEPDCP